MTRLHVPELGGVIGLRTLSAADRARFLQHDEDLGVVWLCARGIADAQGRRIFSDDDIDLLGEKSGAWLTRVAGAIREVSGLSATALAIARARIDRPERLFELRLSLAYGRPVPELLEVLSGQDIVDLMAFEEAHGPLPDLRGDYHAAQIICALAEIHRDPNKHPEPNSVSKFLLKFRRGTADAVAPVSYDAPPADAVPSDEEPWQKAKRMISAGWDFIDEATAAAKGFLRNTKPKKAPVPPVEKKA